MNVQIYSRKEIETLIAEGNFQQNTAAISFCDSGTKPRERVNYSRVCKRVMYIWLDDLELDELEAAGFSYETFFPQADEAAEFIIDAYNSGMDIICQCEYGQSRSAGCAAAIKEYIAYDGLSIFADYRYYPNKVVYHKILDALKAYTGPKRFEIDRYVELRKFNGTSENVVIPNGVTLIRHRAFEDSTIKYVYIPDSVRVIEDGAFWECAALEAITISRNVTRFGDATFYSCNNLEFIEIPPKNYVGANPFLGTKWVRDYTDDFIVINGVLIGYQGNQSKVVIPDNVRVVGLEAFLFYDKLKEIVIPKTVEKIGFNAFGNCENLELITIENPNTEISDWSFGDCPNIKRIICCGKSVLIDASNDKADDFTETVSEIVASVCKNVKDI